MVSTVKAFSKNNSLIGERVSHLLVNHENSFGVLNEFQFELFKLLVATKRNPEKSENPTLRSVDF